MSFSKVFPSVISCIRFLVELIILNLPDFVNTNKRNFLFFVVSYIFDKFFLWILRSDFLFSWPFQK